MKLHLFLLAIGSITLPVRASSDQEPRRLIKTKHQTTLMSNQQVEELVRKGIKFMDITYGGELSALDAPQRPYIPGFRATSLIDHVEASISNISIDRMKTHLHKLSSFRNRFYRARTGQVAAEWIYQTIKELTQDSPLTVTVQRLIHSHWPQFTVRCRIDGPDGTTQHARERVILSAHLDSTAMFAPMWMPAPGADDDGSGVVTQLEAIALIASRKWNLFRPIEFIFFAAEEGGLLGSQNVVRYYQEQEIPAALLHIDMDGFVKRGSKPGIGLLKDNTDPQLNELLVKIITTYSQLPIKETTCGYACSDHYSWHLAGYPVAALFEGTMGEMNPNIHRQSDTVEKINFDHMAEFVKVSIGFALHMAVEQPEVEYY